MASILHVRRFRPMPPADFCRARAHHCGAVCPPHGPPPGAPAAVGLGAGWRPRCHQQDAAAVGAGLELPWSTWPVEGHINRLKYHKRQIFGRASRALLRKRVQYRPGRGGSDYQDFAWANSTSLLTPWPLRRPVRWRPPYYARTNALPPCLSAVSVYP